MTLPASGPLVLGLASGGNSINSEFGYGNDLGSYRGVYYGLGGQEFRFPVSPNSIAMNLFYSTYKIVGGSRTFNSTQSFVIPVYNTITITVQGGQGGASGAPGYISSPCTGAGKFTSGSSGGYGSGSSFGGYLSAAGGAGGAGSASSSNPGQSGQVISTTYTNPVQGGSGPPSGTTVTVSIGGGGSGGGGGCLVYQLIVGTTNFGCACWNNAASGSGGAAGVVTVTWA